MLSLMFFILFADDFDVFYSQYCLDTLHKNVLDALHKNVTDI